MEAIEIEEIPDSLQDATVSYPAPELQATVHTNVAIVEVGEVSRSPAGRAASLDSAAAQDVDQAKNPRAVPALERNATVLFDASWTKKAKEPQQDVHVNKLERQMSRPSTAVSLSWSNLKVVAPGAGPSLKERLQGISDRKPDKVILKNVSGIAMPGQLIAIMGASGAGKSTFLNVLSNQNTSRLKVTGSVRLNGREAFGSDVGHLSAYVQQEDIFFGTLTVREHLKFQAIMRMEGWMSKKQKLERVEQVLFEMGLKKCENTIIGIPGKIKGISGGEKKRLSFASEILTNPALMFLDEPTSGLDSFMAEAVVSLLHKVAASGRTILCTIHQPSSEVFALFDHILLLAEGQTAYLGPTSKTPQFLADNGYPCPENYNPADFYVHTLAIIPGKEQQCKEQVAAICDAFDKCDLGDEVRAAIKEEEYKENQEELAQHDGLHISHIRHHDKRDYNASFFTQLRYVTWRAWLANTRDPTATRVRFGQTVVFAFLIGLMYLQADLDESAIQNLSGAMTFTLIQASVGNLFAVLQIIPLEMPVFLREHLTRLYMTPVYFLARAMADIPFIIGLSFIFSTIIYFMIGLRDGADHFFAFYGVVLIVSLVALAVGYCASAAAPTVSVALALGPVTFIPFLLFGGFFQRADTVKDYLVWLKFLSWFYYGFELLMVNQWSGLHLDTFNTTTGNCTVTESSLSFCTGDGALDFFGLDADNVRRDIGLLFVLFFAASSLAFTILTIRVRRSEK